MARNSSGMGAKNALLAKLSWKGSKFGLTATRFEMISTSLLMAVRRGRFAVQRCVFDARRTMIKLVRIQILKRLIFGYVLCLFIFASANAQNPAGHLTADGGFTSTPVKECHSDLHYFNQVSGWQAAWPAQWEVLTVSNSEGLEKAIEYWASAPRALMEAREVLQLGIETNQTAPRAVVSRVYQQARDLSARLSDRDPSYYFADETDTNKARWNLQMTEAIAPAVEEFASFLEMTYLPEASPVPGLAGVKAGAECFAQAAKWWTTLSLTPEEIEGAGRRLLAQTRKELLATDHDGEGFAAIVLQLRQAQEHDQTTTEQLKEISAAAIARAINRANVMFKVDSLSDVTVEEMPVHMQASFPAGFYRPAQNDLPAAYIINPSRPGERRLMAEAIAFHETVPGHHLFFAYPRKSGSSAFNAGIVEGWAIYAEYVADELGLYSSNFDRQGMIAKHLWAASRLVVEPGLHLHGWSRDEAIKFMLDNTALSQPEIEIEVDRYLALPGQSLSYMLGADLIMGERQCAMKIMGDAFDIKEFHDVILSPGVRPLSELRHDVRTWVALSVPSTDGGVSTCASG